MAIGICGESGGLLGTDYGDCVSQAPLCSPGEGILTCIYDQVRAEEYVISVQFLGSQQDVSTCRKKKRQQAEDTPCLHVAAYSFIGP